MKQKKNTAILLAVLAAGFYAVSTPVSKMLLSAVPPTMVGRSSTSVRASGWAR